MPKTLNRRRVFVALQVTIPATLLALRLVGEKVAYAWSWSMFT